MGQQNKMSFVLLGQYTIVSLVSNDISNGLDITEHLKTH